MMLRIEIKLCQYADDTSLLLGDRTLAGPFDECTKASAVEAEWYRNITILIKQDYLFLAKRKIKMNHHWLD